MSREHMLNEETFSGSNDMNARRFKSSNNKVDINLLMSRVREDQKKEKKESILLFGLLGCVLVLTGIVASL